MHPALARGLTGAAFGAVFGTLLLGIGAIRIIVALATGQPLDLDEFGSSRTLVLIVLYIGSFSIAGATLSALWPLRRSRLGAYSLGYLGAAIVSAILGGLVMWLKHDRDLGTNAIVVGIMTIIFGTAAGYKIHHWERLP